MTTYSFDFLSSNILNWLIGGIFSIALLIQVSCYTGSPQKLTNVSLYCFAIGNLLSLTQGILLEDTSLWIPAGIQSGCIIAILIQKIFVNCTNNQEDSDLTNFQELLQES
jgi:hypothetical protein